MSNEKLEIIKKNIDLGNLFHKKVYPYFKEFLNFLHSEKLYYFLSYGTLLGCIRNKKRIPWDDDYDIYMHTSEIKCFEKYSQDTSNIICKDKEVIYYLKLKNYSYLITKTKYKFYQVWGYKEGVGILNKTTDIFCEKNKNCELISIQEPFYREPIKCEFHDLICNISKNSDKQLKNWYGDNYINEYVVSNHTFSSCYRDSQKKDRIILTKEEFDELMKDL